MSNTYTWSVTQLQVYPNSEGEMDVVCAAAWNVSGTNGTYNGSLNGSTAFKLNPNEPFVPYDQLTQDLVLGWIWDTMGTEGKASAEEDVDAQIAYAASQVATPPLPWGN